MIDFRKNLDEFNQIINATYPNVYSVMIYQNNEKIFENYYRNAQPYDRRDTLSVVKSFLSALVGIAIDKGYIEDVNQHILDFFPNYLHADSDPNILRIRIKHLLTMTSGFYYLRLAGDSQPVAKRMESSDDWVKYILDLPIKHPDLKTFCYSNFDACLISAIIKISSGMELYDFAYKYLFSPLGIALDEWGYSDPNSMFAGNLNLMTNEMAVFGLLYLNKGYYNGQQILPKNWVEQSTKNYGNGYGYMWWINGDNIYMASGAGGTIIMVIPNHNTVVVSSAKHLKTGWKSPSDAVMQILLNDIV